MARTPPPLPCGSYARDGAVEHPVPVEEGVRWCIVGGVRTKGGWRVRWATSRQRELTLVAGWWRGSRIEGGLRNRGRAAMFQQ
jgi:hypothetical protein